MKDQLDNENDLIIDANDFLNDEIIGKSLETPFNDNT
jgi:hypothetical protein